MTRFSKADVLAAARRITTGPGPDGTHIVYDGPPVRRDDTPFTRTSCSCPDCVRCCHEQPGSCAPGDVERIADHLGLPVRVAALKFVASPGALVGNRDTSQVFRIGTITPRRRDGRCVFLDQTDRCTIHAVAPFGCAFFDTHMSPTDAQPISLWLAQAQTDPAYQSLRRTLPAATYYKPKLY